MFSRCTITFLVVFLTLLRGNAQSNSTALSSIYEKEVIYFSGNKYVKANTRYKLRNLKKEFAPDTEAFRLYENSRTDFRKGKYYAWVGLGLYAAGLFVAEKNSGIGIGLVVAGGCTAGFSLGFQLTADKKLKKAVWLRNKDVLLQQY